MVGCDLNPDDVLQDTVTGFLLAGVGNIDMRKNKNFLVVTDSETLSSG